jgi:hypothetical protein
MGAECQRMDWEFLNAASPNSIRGVLKNAITVDLSKPISFRILVLPAGSSAPALTLSQPGAKTLTAGTADSVSITATDHSGGTSSMAYQWKKNGTAITSGNAGDLTGYTAATLNFTSPTTSDAGSYSCAVTDTVTGVNAGTYSTECAQFVVTVNKAGPTTALTSITPSPVCAGSTVSLTATVSGGTSPSGNVQFFDGATSLGTAAISSGTATLPGVTLSVGTHNNITAKYLGDGNNNTSTSTAGSVTVNPAAATSAISGSTSVAIGQAGQVYSVTPTSGSSYVWTVPSGAAITAGGGTASITVTFGSASGSVGVTETTSLGCVGFPMSLGVTVTGNHAPVAPAAKSLTTAENTAATYNTAKLLVGATDADNDTLTVTAASTPTAHGTTVLEAYDVKYTPATGYVGSDSYTYTISDGNGGTAIGTVNVIVTSNNGASPNVVGSPTFDSGTGTFSVTFAGIPGVEYTVEYAEGSAAPPWTKLSNVTAGSDGLFTVTDGPGLSDSRYYRTVYPSY